ncbi:MAG: branched-chain amino acid ABC transporter permease [Clostridiales bacterium]|nr:branched-chain amino acid ABC transporter permease [Clostridiales bacterium]
MELVKEALWSSKSTKIQTGAIVAALIVLFALPNFIPIVLSLPAWIIAYAVMSVAWTFFSGKTGYISLASAAFCGIGMYLQALLGKDVPLPATMLLSAVVAFGAAFGIGIVTLRLRGVYFTIFTFGLALFLNKAIRWYEVTYTFTKGRMVKAYDNDLIFLAMAAVLAVTLFGIIILNKSRFGQALDCIGQNEDSAQHIGVNTTMTKVLAFAISAAPVGATGAVMATTIGYVDPEIAFRILTSFFPVLMAIFGGMRNLYGPIVGAVVFYSLQHYLLMKTDKYMIIFGAVMIVVIMIMPKGVFGIVDIMAARARRKYGGEVSLDA